VMAVRRLLMVREVVDVYMAAAILEGCNSLALVDPRQARAVSKGKSTGSHLLDYTRDHE
jgi:hypothetical protein